MNTALSSTTHNDHDIEKGSPFSDSLPQRHQNNCWGRTCTDYSQYLASFAGAGSLAGGAYTVYKTDYVATGIFLFVFGLTIALIIRTHCLGRLKSQGEQNEILAQNIAKLTQENLNLQKSRLTIEKEKEDYEHENEKIRNELQKDNLEVQKLNKALKGARTKLDELGPLYTKFKELETQLSKQNNILHTNEDSISQTASEIDKEDDKIDKLNKKIQDNTKALEKENLNFSSKLQEFHQLVLKTQSEIVEFENNYSKINAELARLKKTEKLMKDLNDKFKSFVANIQKLSTKYPDLKPILEALK